jgi:hypothetical protein
MKNNIKIYFHIATVGNYQEIVDEINDMILKSGLIEKSEDIFISVVGDGQVDYPKIDKFKLERIPGIESGEFYTLNKIKKFSDSSEDNYKILYIHTKGVTTPVNQCITDWRNYMSYFNIVKHQLAIDYLDRYDTYGVDLVEEPVTHYSGNFWWANSNYIKFLPTIDKITGPGAKFILTPRHNAEFWICMKKGNHKSIHNSDINVYERHLHLYQKSLYQLEN